MTDHYTEIPNQLLDNLMRDMTGSELRVVLTVCRKTRGWHKPTDMLSISQIQKFSGLSRRGTINGIKLALEHGFVTRARSGVSYLYAIGTLEEASGAENAPVQKVTSAKSAPELVHAVDQSEAQVVHTVVTQNKSRVKQTSKRNGTGAKSAPTEQNLTSLFPIVKALSEVTGMDLGANRGRLFREAKLLVRASPPPTVDIIQEKFGTDGWFWHSDDWRARRGERPTPGLVRELWGRWALPPKGAPRRAPRNGEGAPDRSIGSSIGETLQKQRAMGVRFAADAPVAVAVGDDPHSERASQ